MEFNQTNQNQGNVINSGTLQKVNCPHCGKTIRRPLHCVLIPDDKIVQHSYPCPHCLKLVHYEGRWELVVVAGKERIQ